MPSTQPILVRTTDEIEIAVAYLSGELRQRRTGLGWAAVDSLPPPAGEPSLHLRDVDCAFDELAALTGSGSSSARSDQLRLLLARATEAEQGLLRRLILGDVRQGALDAAMVDAVAAAADVPIATVRRAVMLRGATGPVAVAALTQGRSAVEAVSLTVGQPVRPMLASTASDVAAAFSKLLGSTEAIVDTKLDGIRIQVHKAADRVWVFTRSLDDITDRLPEVAQRVRRLPVVEAILDGEALALDPSGRPRPFQETAARTATSGAGAATEEVTPIFFDCLYVDGESLIDLPLTERLQRLDAIVPAEFVTSRVLRATPETGAKFFATVVADGQEGVVIKAPQSPYDAGRRGSSWVKVKPRHTLDLVVLAVEEVAVAEPASSPTFISAPAIPRPTASSCSARPSRG